MNIKINLENVLPIFLCNGKNCFIFFIQPLPHKMYRLSIGENFYFFYHKCIATLNVSCRRSFGFSITQNNFLCGIFYSYFCFNSTTICFVQPVNSIYHPIERTSRTFYLSRISARYHLL